MTPGRKGLLLAAWLAAVAGLGWVVERELVVGSDLQLDRNQGPLIDGKAVEKVFGEMQKANEAVGNAHERMMQRQSANVPKK